MIEIPENPFKPLELWDESMVTVKDGDDRKQVDAKHYHVMYLVGEGLDKKFVHSGEGIESYNEKTLYIAPSVHKISEEPFHYDGNVVRQLSGKENTEQTKDLKRLDFCEDHELVEVAFESPGVECCAMTKEQADKQKVPLQYLAGYLLGKADGIVKVALSKTELESGGAYYESIHVIPESAIKTIQCLE